MKKTVHTTKIEHTLKKQISVLEAISDCQNQMRAGISERNWVAAENSHIQLEKLSEEFLQLDQTLYDGIYSAVEWTTSDIDFYAYSKKIPAKDRIRLNALYRELQNRMFLAKAENASFTAYVNHMQTLVRQMVNTITAEKKTASYTHTGGPSPNVMQKMVLDRTF